MRVGFATEWDSQSQRLRIDGDEVCPRSPAMEGLPPE